MNFYEHQNRARKQSVRLVALFALSLILLSLLTAFIIASVAYVLGFYNGRLEQYETGQPVWEIAAKVFDWQFLGSIGLGVILVVGLAALFRMLQLSSGGKAIAEQLGGRLLNTHPRDPLEKRVLNVVEEMAIAAGMPVPSVYLIDEPGINAFAAGYQPADAVIGVTRGAIENLSRHELQGVIAHEFSHILNGDMRLNLRLIALIYGIVVIALSGRVLLHSGRFSRKDRGASLSIGVVLIALGYLGVFLGNIIKAAISRQREYLADASAVQFTRSQEGIRDALKKIGGHVSQQDWQQHDSNEISHMLFSSANRFHFFNRLMSTHPPLAERIKRIDPQWNGGFSVVSSVKDEPLSYASDSSVSDFNASGSKGVHAGNVVSTPSEALASDYAAGLESPFYFSDNDMALAQKTLTDLNRNYEKLCQDIHQPYGARALVFAMLIDQSSSESIRKMQWLDLNQSQQVQLSKQTYLISEQMQSIDASKKMVLLDLSLPILKLLSEKQYLDFKQQMLRLIKMDKKVELREWALFNLVNYYCRPPQLRSLRIVSLSQRKPVLAKLLGALVRLSVDDETEAEALFNSAVKQELTFSLRWYPKSELSIKTLSEALTQLRQLKPLEKPRFLKACIRIVEHDGVLDSSELEVINCIAQAMDCPMPRI